MGCDGAIAHISGSASAPELRGTVRFLPRPGGTLVLAQIEGLPEFQSGFVALHIHETGNCRGEGFPNTGSHFNLENLPHPYHAGDLPPLLRRWDGRAWLAVVTDRFAVRDVVGKSVVIHSGADDFKTQPSGGAGSKIGCGVILPMGKR